MPHLNSYTRIKYRETNMPASWKQVVWVPGSDQRVQWDAPRPPSSHIPGFWLSQPRRWDPQCSLWRTKGKPGSKRHGSNSFFFTKTWVGWVGGGGNQRKRPTAWQTEKVLCEDESCHPSFRRNTSATETMDRTHGAKANTGRREGMLRKR